MGQKKKLKTSEKPNKRQKVNNDKSAKKLENQSLDEFLAGWDKDDSDAEEPQEVTKVETSSKKPSKTSSENKENEVKKKKKKEKKKKKKVETPKEESDEEENVQEGESSDEEEPTKSSGAKSQKKYINSLKDKDPEFYKFLKSEDAELLNFDESSEDEEKEEDAEGAVHELPDKLEVASDESDYEEEEQDEEEEEEDGEDGDVSSSGKIKKEMVEKWISDLENPTQGIIATVVEAFRAAVSTVGSGDSEEQPCKFRVEGPTMFNSVVRMCVLHLSPAVRKFLRQGDDKDDIQKPQRSKKWKRIEKSMRIYLSQLCVLVSRVAEPSVAAVLLKHTHQMIPFFQTHPKGEKQLLVQMVKCWSQSEETVRVLALVCIIRIVRTSHNLLEPALKQMYMSYVRNTKFTSPSTLPLINFMRRSLVEIYGLDHKIAYYQAFIQIRQLAIHLRNAIVHSKKEHLQAVFNWQFVHSLELWGALLGHTAGSDILQPLIYPLVQVALGLLRLNPSSKYFPLRFHLANMLSNLAVQTGTFIPVLPIYLDVMRTFNFSKKSKKASMKPLEFACILKASKSQQIESGFKDTTVEEVYAGLVTYLAHNSNKIGFPELVIPLVFQLKDFLKNCKIGNYCKKMKQILDKVVTNMKFIENRRKNVTFGVCDFKEIEIWEAQVERDGTPLLAFYKSWKKVADTNKMKRLTQSINMDDVSHIPLLKKNHKKIRMKTEQEPEAAGFLSGSDDDDEMDDEERFKLKEERQKGGKTKKADEKNKADNDADESDEDDSGEDLEDDVEQNGVEDESDDDDGEDAEDQVTDLRLEDMGDSDEDDVDMKDDFGAEEDSNDDDSDNDDDGDESD